MVALTFDSNIFIARPRVELPGNFHMSVVVLAELVVGAQDETEVKALNTARSEYEKAGRLLVPNAEDWWLVELGKTQFEIASGRPNSPTICVF